MKGAKTPRGERRPPYITVADGPWYANTIDKVRRGQSGDKLRRKAFEGRLR